MIWFKLLKINKRKAERELGLRRLAFMLFQE